MSSYVEILFNQYRFKGLLIDANLLLLYLVGSYDLRLVGDGKFNKLSKYTVEDYGILVSLKSLFQTIVTTPHVLTEVSNLTADLPESVKMKCFDQFGDVFNDFDEYSIPGIEVAARPDFRFLGLTDSVLAQMCERFLVVSDDARFIGRLNDSGYQALNFNHLRQHLFVEKIPNP